MTKEPSRPAKAYRNRRFINSRNARPLRILAEYAEPESRFAELEVSDTIVFMGSARTISRQEATQRLKQAQKGSGDVREAERQLAMSRFYEDARELAGRLTTWSKTLDGNQRRFVVCTGGGPGIMEAANRGASEARGLNIGLGISLPREPHNNPYITRGLDFEFHYFFMRKFWFLYLAKAVVFFPGGFGTLDEFFEIMTLAQTGKLNKKLPLVLFGTEYWSEALDLERLASYGTIDTADLDLVFRTDSVDAAYDHITRELTAYALGIPGPRL